MKYSLRSLLLLAALPLASQAQNVGIGTTAPAASSALEVRTTNQGLLLPRLTAAQRATIANPAPGLLVFQTDGTLGIYQYSGVAWINQTGGRVPDADGSTVPANGAAVSTLAGSGNPAYADGTGAAASFSYPSGVAVDAAGSVYVADQSNNRIRKTTAAGVVSTLAGSGSASYADGTGAAAGFNNPIGVAVDAAGTVYVADTNNHRIRKISPAGVVSTLAGSGSASYADGAGLAASFSSPTGVAVDAAGTVYVADQGNQRIRKITVAGVVSTLAGATSGYADGPGPAARFSSPSGVAVDAGGTVYVADYANQRIRKITAAGVVSTLAGTGSAGYADGLGVGASFNNPRGIAVDAGGTLYVGDFSNQRIRKISLVGMVSTLAGSGSPAYADGTGPAASFNTPFGVAVDANGTVYVSDSNNQRIRVIK